MPMLAVVALAAGATAAVTAIAAVSVLTAITYVGIGMSVIGAVTGNKNFSKVGAVMGLAGGIGSMVSGAMSAGTAAVDAGTIDAALPVEGAAEAADAVDAVDSAGNAASGTSMGDPMSTGVDATGADFNAAAGAPPVPTADTGLSTSTNNPSALADSNATPTTQSKGLLTSTQPVQPDVPAVGNEATTVNPNITAGDPMATGVSPPTDTTSGGIKNWWSNKLTATERSEIMKMGGSAVGKMFEGWSAEQKLAFEREQAALKQANIDKTQANLSGQAVVNFKPVDYPVRPGILGSARG